MAVRYRRERTGVPVVSYQDNSPPPAGSIEAYAGGVIPDGWLLCDGQAVSQTTYSQLFARIGSSFNTQINPTTGAAWASPGAGLFRVPDYRGIFLRGVGTASGGTATTLGGFQNDQFQGHGHAVGRDSDGSPVIMNGATGGNNQFNGTFPINTNASSPRLGAGAAMSDGINGPPRTGTETRPKNSGVNYIIKCFDATYVAYGAGLATGARPGLVYQTPQTALVVTSGQFAFNPGRCVGIAYMDNNGVWRLKGNIAAGITTDASFNGLTFSISGVVFKNLAGYQAVAGMFGSNAGYLEGFTNPNASTITVSAVANAVSTGVSVSFDVELESKPTWA